MRLCGVTTHYTLQTDLAPWSREPDAVAVSLVTRLLISWLLLCVTQLVGQRQQTTCCRLLSAHHRASGDTRATVG